MNHRPGSVRRALGWAVVAVTGLTGLWWWAPPHTPPVYDGVCVANPYQYLDPPAGAAATKPTSAKHTVDVSGVVPGTIVMTAEFPAQAQMSTDDGSLVAPGARTVTLTIAPSHAPPKLPGDGRIDGNVYTLGATTDAGKSASVDASKPPTLTLRTAIATGDPEVIEHFDGTSWTQVPSQPVANCSSFFSATITGLGEYALVLPSGPASSESGSTPPTPSPARGGGSSPVAVIVIAVVVVLIGAALWWLRLRNLKATAQRGTPPGRPR